MGDKEEFVVFGDSGGGGGGGGGGKFQFLQPNRDLQSNWEVDLAKNLEEYLIRICSGEPTDHDHSVNFAEAALLLQGSIQVYSRKVEYLYYLVLHALEFLAQKKQDQPESASIQPDGGESTAVVDEENENFLGLDDVPVEAKNCLDAVLNKDENSNQFLKPPANLLVLEGDCLDSGGDAGELASYLLATCDFYGDFLLLDPCDVGAVHEYLNADSNGKDHVAAHQTSSIKSKSRHSFPSPSRRSGGAANKSCPGKNVSTNFNESLQDKCAPEYDNDNLWSQPNFDTSTHKDGMWHGEEPDVGCSDIGDDSDSEDPWKPLNPHEPGNLKIKPFRKGKTYGRQLIHNGKQNIIASQFPIAKLDGTISPEFAETLESQLHAEERLRAPQSPPLYEKLRRSLVLGDQETPDSLGDHENENDDNAGDTDFPDFDQTEFDLAHSTYDMDTDVPLHQGKQSDGAASHDGFKVFDPDNLDSHASLEDLCRSHLDALLASIAEAEKQTELAARVSTWKQRIELSLEEQDRHPPFDIHQYGERILDKLSLEADSEGSMSFVDVVVGQPKHDVARTFSALLQLVNNGDVDLQRPQSSQKVVCYTAANPFNVRLLRNERREVMAIRSSKKRVKSPLRKGCSKANTCSADATSPMKSPRPNGRLALKLGKASVIRCTPEGKRRRRSRLVDPVDFQSCG